MKKALKAVVIYARINPRITALCSRIGTFRAIGLSHSRVYFAAAAQMEALNRLADNSDNCPARKTGSAAILHVRVKIVKRRDCFRAQRGDAIFLLSTALPFFADGETVISAVIFIFDSRQFFLICPRFRCAAVRIYFIILNRKS